jgi:hypothetical protein
MSKVYQKLDSLIIKAVSKNRASPMYDPDVCVEARRIADATGRNDMRVIDGRLTALRKSGAIRYFNKPEAPNNKAGWYVACAEKV